MIIFTASVTLLAVWAGAWMAGIDQDGIRDYYSTALVTIIASFMRPLLGPYLFQHRDMLSPILVAAGNPPWVFGFEVLLITIVTMAALGANLRQALIISSFVLIVDILMATYMPLIS